MKLAHSTALDTVAQFVSDIHAAGFQAGVESLRLKGQDLEHIDSVVRDRVSELFSASKRSKPSPTAVASAFNEILTDLGFGPPSKLDEIEE